MLVLPATADNLSRAVAILRSGGVVAHATETCYGLACYLSNLAAVTKLFRIKDRPLDQPVSALFSSVKEAKQYVEWTREAEKLANEHLPGPLTIILPMKPKAPSVLFPNPNPNPNPNPPTLGVRISSHTLAQQLVSTFGCPISTTSANLHGQPNPYCVDDILKQFADREFQPDLILDSGTLPTVPPSTVIDVCSGKGHVRRTGEKMI